MSEIAIISTREVLYNAPSQKFGKIKVTLKMYQKFETYKKITNEKPPINNN